jgi:hypothetical protein
MHKVLYTWWCWHICKGIDNGEENYAKVNGGEHTCIAKREGGLCALSFSLIACTLRRVK